MAPFFILKEFSKIAKSNPGIKIRYKNNKIHNLFVLFAIFIHKYSI